MIARLLVGGLHETGQIVALDRDQIHYAHRVLRLRPGDPVQAFDGLGARWSAVLSGDGRDAGQLRLVERLPALPESPLRVTLVQCISSAERMDFTIEKAVELGVAVIVPVASARSVVRLDDERARKRLAHWQRLVVAACMQCGRDVLPAVAAPQSLADYLAGRARDRRGWVLAPLAGQSLRQAAMQAARDAPLHESDLLIGPESGLTDDELAQAGQAGLALVGLGPRVLRTETAGLAALALLQSAHGDLV